MALLWLLPSIPPTLLDTGSLLGPSRRGIGGENRNFRL
jgi:hypothetical protein